MSTSDTEELAALRLTYEDPDQAVENDRQKNWITIRIDGVIAVQKLLEDKGVLSHVLDAIPLGYGQADVCVRGKQGMNAVQQACATLTMDIQLEGTNHDVLMKVLGKRAFFEHMNTSYAKSFYPLSPIVYQFRRDRCASFERALVGLNS